MKMLQEFKEFAMKGNVVDMAVGVIIGTAFGKIVGALVTDVVMPPLGVLIGGMNFTDLALTIKQASEGAPAVVIAYGKFIQTVVDFTIIAWVIFLAIKGINMLKRQKEEAPAPEAPPPAPTPTECLLGEIRDLLKQK
ncbi:MAG: large-conductance mechanosensitive channel [Desulfobulbaceae bacterium A2]|nr:MAG: large-conductance mechanosensitive channel [Desulfobulbaceae bacterium A2]